MTDPILYEDGTLAGFQLTFDDALAQVEEDALALTALAAAVAADCVLAEDAARVLPWDDGVAVGWQGDYPDPDDLDDYDANGDDLAQEDYALTQDAFSFLPDGYETER